MSVRFFMKETPEQRELDGTVRKGELALYVEVSDFHSAETRKDVVVRPATPEDAERWHQEYAAFTATHEKG